MLTEFLYDAVKAFLYGYFKDVSTIYAHEALGHARIMLHPCAL